MQRWSHIGLLRLFKTDRSCSPRRNYCSSLLQDSAVQTLARTRTPGGFSVRTTSLLKNRQQLIESPICILEKGWDKGHAARRRTSYSVLLRSFSVTLVCLELQKILHFPPKCTFELCKGCDCSPRTSPIWMF